MATIGERLQQARERKGLTQAELGERIGRNQKMVSRYETDYTPVSLDLLVRLARELDVSADWLLGLSDDTKGLVDTWQNMTPEARKIAELVNKQRPEAQAELLRLVTFYITELMLRGAH